VQTSEASEDVAMTQTGEISAVETRAVLVHRRATRWMHWINFPLILIMLWSGFRIYWANDVYAFGIGDWTLFEFFPEWFYERLDLNRHLARGLAFHLAFGWLFAINGMAYAIYTATSGEWRQLVPDRQSIKDLPAVLAHDIGLRKVAPPQGRYNAAQRLTYTIIVMLGGIALVTGFAIYKPIQLSLVVSMFGGYETARLIHFVCSISFIVFFVVHIIQVIRAGWGNFTSMLTGYEVQEESDV
jgi:thiosulfate reductase cytochrome b subunit